MENKTIKDNYYKTEKLFDRVYRISSLEGTFLFLFLGDRKALLMDTAYGFGNLKEAVRKITDLPLVIVNSHGHLDHVCGNFQFDEDIYIHASDLELCKSHNSTESRQKIVMGAQKLRDFSSGKTRNALPEDFSKDYYIHQGYGNLVPLSPDHVFDLGVPFDEKEFREFAPRICTHSGFGPNDTMKPGFAAIIIDRLRCYQ